VSYIADGCEPFSGFLPLDTAFSYFKVFAWADNIAFDLDCTYSAIGTEEIDNNAAPFKMGNLVFRLGDMFNRDALSNSNLIILPASTIGTITPNISNRAAELRIPSAPKGTAGNIKIFKVEDGGPEFYAGYAYSVKIMSTTVNIIKKICEQLIKTVRKMDTVSGVNLPLLGTGAGQLEPVEVAEIFNRELNQPKFEIQIIVSIPSQEVFRQIKNAFQGRYIPFTYYFEKEKPDAIKELELELERQLNPSDYEVNINGEVTALYLGNVSFSDGSFLQKFQALQTLNLSNHSLKSYKALYSLKNLRKLYLSSVPINNYDFLFNLEQLNTLDLSFNNLEDVSFLRDLHQVKNLHLGGNLLTNLRFIDSLTNLEYLDVSDNKIISIDGVERLEYLSNLNVSRNKVTDISPLKYLKGLMILDISENEIFNVDPISGLRKLTYLRANINPFTISYQLSLKKSDNHLTSLKNYFTKQRQRDRVPLTLPAKVVLLGNHASGKSSLLHYVMTDTLSKEMDSTHIIRIYNYPPESTGIPEAVFFDFGGQDYYHGIYRAFLSEGSIYLMLWNQKNNFNQQRKDSRQVMTQDFKLNYWFAQKKYIENQNFNGNQDPVLLIQSYADQDTRAGYSHSPDRIEIKNEFFLSFKATMPDKTGDNRNALGLAYLKASILDLAATARITQKQPRWFVDFITYILNERDRDNHQSIPIRQLLSQYQRQSNDDLHFLKDDLKQLHLQGLILYYDKILPDQVWLNPVALVKYIHEQILNDASLEKYRGKVPASELNALDKDGTIRLLQEQKVIFYHQYSNEYIIPNFLPLVSESQKDFDLFTFGIGLPLFVLKFKNFLPFGLINQVICFFGTLPESKKFWRDQLLFTFEKRAKILINIDFCLLEIKVYAAFLKDVTHAEKQEIIRYLFYGLIGLYWDFDLLSFEDFRGFYNKTLTKDMFEPENTLYKKIEGAEVLYLNDNCRPNDLFISVNGQQFIHYSDLCSMVDSAVIRSYILNPDSQLEEASKPINIYPFQPFTPNTLRRRKKSVISYSKYDITLVDRFRNFLVPLIDDGLMEAPWFCSELVAGTDWDEEIQRKFDEADIIFFMVSENLMAVQYVKDYEIKNAIDKWDLNRSVKIVPIILRPYRWQRSGNYNLGRFSALPYKAIAATSWPDQSDAWKFTVEAIRIMILEDWNPEADIDHLNQDMELMIEKVVKTLKDLL
jgi:hypothetical protein